MSALPLPPIVGRKNVARAFGVSKSTLERWEKDTVLSRMFGLSKFTFRLGHRVATTPALVARFFENAQKNDPRERLKRAVAEVAS